MASNDFLVWCASGGANAYTPMQLAALPNLTTGVVPGIADPKQANAVWRQSTIMASMIGAFIIAQLNENVVDDGTTTAVLAQFKRAVQSMSRTILAAPLTLYVSPTGNDANNGTFGSPFLTIQHAINVLYTKYDLATQNVTVQLADGTYTAGAALFGAIPGQQSYQDLIIQGNLGTPTNVIITGTNIVGVYAEGGGAVTVQGVYFNAITGSGATGIAIGAGPGGQVTIGPNVVFGGCTVAHISSGGGRVLIGANYTVSSAANYHLATDGGRIEVQPGGGFTGTVTGGPNFSSQFAFATNLGLIEMASFSYSGAATGQRYTAQANSAINTFGGGASFFPGNAAGAVSTGGQYL